MSCPFAAERALGPTVNPCRRAFDFTLFFEELFFALLPSSVLLICSAIRLSVLVRRPVLGLRGWLYYLKLVTTLIFGILELLTLLLICTSSGEITRISTPAAVLSLLAALAIGIVSHYEHTRSCRASFLLTVYLCVAVLLRSAMARTYWFLEAYTSVASTTLAAVVVQIMLVALESGSKQGFPKVSSEESASFISRSLFLWLNNLLWTGYRRTLSVADLQPIDQVLYASRLSRRFSPIFNASPSRYLGLPGQTLFCLGRHLLLPVLPRLCLTAFTFAQPFLTTALIEYLGDKSSSKNNGYGLIGASMLVYAGIAISNSWYSHLAYKSITIVRGGLVDVVFDKMLRLREDKELESKALTLTINDTQRISTTMAFLHELWAGMLETALATWLLWRQVGPSSLTVLGVALASTAVNTFVGKSTSKQQQKWMAATEKRIISTRKMLSALKAIKMAGYEQIARSSIESLRTSEFAASKMFRTLMVGGVLSSYITLTLSPVVVFGAYIGTTLSHGRDLDPARLFSSLILISLLANPLIRILQMLPTFGAAKGCFERLNTFLRKPERSDYRQIQSNQSSTNDLVADNTVTVEHVATKSPKNATAVHDDMVVFLDKASFGWTTNPFFQNISLCVHKGEHIAITGPVGCGKSLLIKALLGEAECTDGIVRIGSARIGYCGQGVWLENTSALDNAFRGATNNDAAWRQKVINACALGDLLDSQLSSETVGSGGVRISGGEKQRLALARTIAWKPDIILLDDSFSALDRKTAKHIRDSLFGTTGILRSLGVTVIETTQDERWVTIADQIYQIDKDHNLVPRSDWARQEVLNTTDDMADIEPLTESTETRTPTVGIASPKQTTNAAGAIADYAVYQTYFGTIGGVNMIIFALFGIAFAFCIKFPDIWAQWWSEDSKQSTHKVGYWIGLYAMLQVLPLAMLCIWLGHLLLRIVPASGVGLHKQLLKTVLTATFRFVSGADTGDLLNRFNQDLMLIDMTLPLHLFNTIAELLTCVIQVVLVAVAAVCALSVLPVLVIVLYLIQHFYLRTSKQLRQLEIQSKASLQTKVVEVCGGLITIRAHGWQNILAREFRQELDRSQEPLYLLYAAQRWLQLTLDLVVAGLSVTVAGVAVGIHDQTSLGAIGVAFLNLTTLGQTMTNLLTSWTSLEVSLGAISRIKAFRKQTPAEPDVASPIDIPWSWPQFGEIQFKGVSSSYGPIAEKQKWVVNNVTLTIHPGQKIALCGRSGSGKSSLLLTLLSLMETSKGTILVDGIDISRVKHSVLRSRFYVISQDVYLHGSETIQEALGTRSNSSNDEVWGVLAICALDDKVRASGGLEAPLSDVSFSAGEYQLFALARIILDAGQRPGGIILLHEATSSVDIDTERRVMRLISGILQDKTTISVLHRLETAIEYDRVLVMDEGRIVNFGTPSEVMQKAELFASLREYNGP